MNKWSSILRVAFASSLFVASGSVFAAYISGSTGADGAYNPTVSESVQLPPDGIFNYTGVNIPSGVTITYLKNAANTPVTILSSGDVTIAGTINVSATTPTNVSDPGIGGPGGYNGGGGGQPGGTISTWVNGYSGPNVGRAGVGPGAGGPGSVHVPSADPSYGVVPDVAVGGGGAFGAIAVTSGGNYSPTTPGVTYGNTTLMPLLGGSGGGGGAGGPVAPGSGGGGGGGAILIAASGTINVTGSILANGGAPFTLGALSTGRGACGGGGSGGAIRLIATTVSGNGTISAIGGTSCYERLTDATHGGTYLVTYAAHSNDGGNGRIRIESESLIRTAATTPTYVGGSPSLVFVPGLPTLSITSVGGVAVPAVPTGNSDVTLPSNFTNPVTVDFVTTGVTVGSSIKLTVTPVKGVAYSVVTSAGTTGTTDLATASVSVNLPSGTNNTLQASVTYTVVASVGDAMGVYAQGERVEKVTLTSTLGSKGSTVMLTTVSGKEYVVPSSVLAMIPG